MLLGFICPCSRGCSTSAYGIFCATRKNKSGNEYSS